MIESYYSCMRNSVADRSGVSAAVFNCVTVCHCLGLGSWTPFWVMMVSLRVLGHGLGLMLRSNHLVQTVRTTLK